MPTANYYILHKGDGSDWNEEKVLAEEGKVLGFDSNKKPVMVAPNAGGMTKSLSVESPTNSEDISIFYTDVAITITKMVAVLKGSASPSVTWSIIHAADRSSLVFNEVVTSGTTTTNTTTGHSVTSFNDATIPANSFIWLKTSARSGTVTEISITIEYTED